MRIVISDKETIGEWLYPGAFSDLPTPQSDALIVPLEPEDFFGLWQALGSPGSRDEVLGYESVNAAGIPHSAPDFVDTLHPGLMSTLLDVPVHQRWRVAQQWATTDDQRPNAQKLTAMKQLVNDLCNLAERARETGRMLVLLQDKYFNT